MHNKCMSPTSVRSDMTLWPARGPLSLQWALAGDMYEWQLLVRTSFRMQCDAHVLLPTYKRPTNEGNYQPYSYLTANICFSDCLLCFFIARWQPVCSGRLWQLLTSRYGGKIWPAGKQVCHLGRGQRNHRQIRLNLILLAVMGSRALQVVTPRGHRSLWTK